MSSRGGATVSVVLSAKNAADRVAASLQSAVNALGDDDEIVAIDDGSTDDTFAVMERALAGARHRLLRTKGIGLTRALQLGVEASSGSFIARLDAGDTMTPDRLRRQLAEFARNPELMLCGGNVRFVDPTGKVLGQSAVLEHDVSLRALLLAGRNPFFHSTWLARADVLREVGGYRAFFRYCQDYDAALRLSTRGKLRNLPDVLGDLLVSTDGISVVHSAEQIRYVVIAREDHVARALGIERPLETRDRPMPVRAWRINFARDWKQRAQRARGRGERASSLFLVAVAYLAYPELAAVTMAAKLAEGVCSLGRRA